MREQRGRILGLIDDAQVHRQRLAAEQDRNKDEAARIWRALLDRSPPNAPWGPLVREALTRVGAPPPEPRPQGRSSS